MARKPKRDLPLQMQPDSSPPPDDGQRAQAGAQSGAQAGARAGAQFGAHSGARAEALTFRQRVCQQGEQIAADYLIGLGYRILHRNWRSGRFTEVDLIALDPNGVITLVEVKTRQYHRSLRGLNVEGYENGFDAVDWRKRRKMLIAARSYLSRHALAEAGCSLDVVVVMYTSLVNDSASSLRGVEVLHVPQAFNDV